MLSDSERLYILIVQYGLARDAEYENKITPPELGGAFLI